MLHGGYASPNVSTENRARSERRPAPTSGYRNLFGDPAAETTADGLLARSEAFGGYGDAERTRDLLVKLARCLEKPYSWPSPGGRNPDDNPRIPSGYTYLAQLVAHDLTFLGSTLPPLEDPSSGPRNLRTIALNLETIYGGGPLERPSSYGLELNGAPRLKLRVGLIGDADNNVPARMADRAALARDLPRAACPMTMDAGPEAKDCLTEVLISDPRNDDHLIIAQTAVLFHLLHNEVCDRLSPVFSPEHERQEWQPQDKRSQFAWARRLVTSIYREIVRGDLMKRLLCEPVHRHYTDGPGPFLDPGGGGGAGMPVEFSHAAFRVGHAMIQPGYKIRHDLVFGLEDVLRFNSERSPGRMPPSSPWIVRWSNFYELDGPPANLSRRLAPSQTRVLFKSPLISLTDDLRQPDLRTGLPRRDLLRGAATRIRSVESLIEHVRSAAPHLAAGSRLLDADPGRRRAVVADFLDGQRGPDASFTDDERDAIAADPPLLLFLLLEAAVEQDGLCLGVLGSVIVGEVIFRAIDDAERAEAGKFPDAVNLAESVFGYDPAKMAEGEYEFRGMPRTMPDLIRFLAELPSLRDAEPAFV